MLLKLISAVVISSIILFTSGTYAAPLKVPRTVYLTGENTLIFNQEVTGISVDGFMKAGIGTRIVLHPSKTLYIVIVSGGGEYESGKNLLGFFKVMPNTEVICKYCGSMAGAIFVEAGVKRLVLPKSQLLMHEMYYSHFTAKMGQNPSYITSLQKDSDDFNKFFWSRIPMTKEAYEKKILNTEWNLYGQEIVANHLADELVNIKCDGYVQRLAPDTCTPKVK